MKAWLCYVDDKECSRDVQKKKLMAVAEQYEITAEAEINLDSQEEIDENFEDLISKLNSKALDLVLLYDIPRYMKKDDFSRLLDCCCAKGISIELGHSVTTRLSFNQKINQQML